MNDVTELVVIIDRSGSMHGLEKDVVGGYNSLIEGQKKEGKTLVSTIFFNERIKLVHQDADIENIKPLEGRQYVPSGCTALLDAIGYGISLIKEKRAKLTEEEIPAHTIFSIMTDGLENSSREYSYKKIKEMIELQKKCGWDFLFQAANIDVEYEADRLGIDLDMAVEFKPSSAGVKRSMDLACSTIGELRRKPRRRGK